MVNGWILNPDSEGCGIVMTYRFVSHTVGYSVENLEFVNGKKVFAY